MLMQKFYFRSAFMNSGYKFNWDRFIEFNSIYLYKNTQNSLYLGIWRRPHITRSSQKDLLETLIKRALGDLEI